MNATMNGPNGTNGTKAPARECPHCHGLIEILGAGRGGRVIERCRTCGREPTELPRDAMAERAASTAPLNGSRVAGKSCSVDGCPGTLDSAGRCACCAKRAAYAEAHSPKRPCGICGGLLTSRANRKYCAACKPVAHRASTNNAPSHAAKRRGDT